MLPPGDLASRVDGGPFTNIEKLSLEPPGLLRRVVGRFWRRSDIQTAEQLQSYLSLSAAYLAHHITIEYTRSRAGSAWLRLQEDEQFLEDLSISRWRAFFICLGLTGEIALAELRGRTSADPQKLAGFLGRAIKGVLKSANAAGTRAEHEAETVLKKIPQQLRMTALIPTRSPSQLAGAYVSEIYDVLPAHKRLRDHDELLLLNDLRMHLISMKHQFVSRAHFRELIRVATRERSSM